MKTLQKKGILFIVAFVLGGCANTVNVEEHNVSAKIFEKEYEQSKIQHFIKVYQLLSKKNGYIYLEKREMTFYDKSKWHQEIICSKVDKLSERVRKELAIRVALDEDRT